MQMVLRFLVVLITLGAVQARASGCVPPELREISQTPIGEVLAVRYSGPASDSRVFEYPGGRKQIVFYRQIEDQDVAFISPVFETRWVSVEELKMKIAQLPNKILVRGTSIIYEVVGDMSDCVDVGTRYRQIKYVLPIEFGMREKMKFVAATGLEQAQE